MPAILNSAAARINASVAGLTGTVALPSQEPGAPQSQSPTEATQHLPTEFGQLSHLFGGEALPTELAPVPQGLETPAGSVKGALGGLVPDFRNTVQGGVPAAAKTADQLLPLSVHVRNTVAAGRRMLGL